MIRGSSASRATVSSGTPHAVRNGTNNANFGFNNVNLYEFVWYHKLTDRLWVATEDYYEYQNNVPTVSTIPGANPALCPPPQTQCLAGAYAASFRVMYQLTNRD